MQKTVVICEGCGRTKLNDTYYTLAYKSEEKPAGVTEDYCSKGCLLRRLSLVVGEMQSCIIARCDLAAAVAPGATNASESAPPAIKPFALNGSG